MNIYERMMLLAGVNEAEQHKIWAYDDAKDFAKEYLKDNLPELLSGLIAILKPYSSGLEEKLLNKLRNGDKNDSSDLAYEIAGINKFFKTKNFQHLSIDYFSDFNIHYQYPDQFIFAPIKVNGKDTQHEFVLRMRKLYDLELNGVDTVSEILKGWKTYFKSKQ